MQTIIFIASSFILILSTIVPRVEPQLTTNFDKINKLEKIKQSVLGFEDEDKYLNTSQLLSKYGLPVKEYSVVTEDGYILNVVRIPRPGPVVLIFHGMVSSSDDFLTIGPKRALPHLLYNAGYEVWLPNARGNKYSQGHVKLSPDERQFWEFSWHEIGYYDLPAVIDFALVVSGQTQLVYIGLSQGTTCFFVLCSERPEYNEKILIAFSLGTAAYNWHAAPQKLLAPFADLQYNFAFGVGRYELLPYDKYKFLTAGLCDLSKAAQVACLTVAFTIFGFDHPQLDFERLSVVLGHIPSGASHKQLLHYLQISKSKRFAQFDHGMSKNLAIYGQPHPPRYPVEKITAPISIFYGVNDYLSNFEDVKILIRELPNVVDVYEIPYPLFNHIDYLFAKDVKELVYLRILKIINASVRYVGFSNIVY